MGRENSFGKDNNGIYHVLRDNGFPHKCSPLDHSHHTRCKKAITLKEIYSSSNEPENLCEICKNAFDKYFTTVSLKANFVIDGYWEGRSRRTISADMDATKIIDEPVFSAAVEYFKSQVPYIDDIDFIEYFHIDGKMYDSNFWSS